MWCPSVNTGLLAYLYDRLAWPQGASNKEVLVEDDAIRVKCRACDPISGSSHEYEASHILDAPKDWPALRSSLAQLDGLVAVWNNFIRSKFNAAANA